MLERFFRKNNKETKPSVSGVVHIDGSLEDVNLPTNSDDLDEEFVKKDIKNFKREDNIRNWDIDQGQKWNISSKVGNERRKQRISDLHSDIKERMSFDIPGSKEERDERILDEMREHDSGNQGKNRDDEFEKAA
jgi:hypothetical protein